MKQAIRYVCVVAVLMVAVGFIANSFVTSQAQSTALLPTDEFITQITSSVGGSFVSDISGDGRFVVIESTGDIATERTTTRNNEDGNREIFLFDYAQRRIFQLTNTRSTLITPTATPTPTPSPSPSPSPTPAPGAPETIEIEVSNNRPVISNDGRFIAFTSNASNPASFDGNDAANRAALAADGNQEIFLYQLPETSPVDLTTGAEPLFVNLSSGAFTRVTDTPASRLPRPGSTTVTPFVADDNRFPSLSDDGLVVAFTSTRNLSANGNADTSPEVFLFNRLNGTFSQLTNAPLSATPSAGRGFVTIFNENPSLSGDGATVAFVSNGNLTGNNADLNAEVYIARLSSPGGASQLLRQVTQTQQTAERAGISVNIFSPGRRLSRDGQFLAFESSARLDGDNAIQDAAGLFLVNVSNPAVASFTFRQIGPRATSGADVLRFPTFATETTESGVTINTLVFTSALNFRANGTAADANNPGLNPPPNANSSSAPQIFAANLAGDTFVRLTNFTTFSDSPRPLASNTRSRIVFSLANTELGGGNSDRFAEAFYLLTQARPNADPTPTPAPGAVSFFTGASQRAVAAATASPTPTPSPVPADAPVGGLAPGMQAIARTTTVAIGPDPGGQVQCQVNSVCLSEMRRPSLPIQLNGVSVSIGGAAAGLSFVSPNQINFVVPIGLAPGLYTVIVNNNGTLVRSQVRIVAAQPDLVTDTNGAGGRAAATNVTNPLLMMGTPEPFTVTTTFNGADGQPRTEATRLRFMLTGVRGATDVSITVRIGTVAITGDANIDVRSTNTPGIDQLDVLLPATLAGAGDVPVIVEVTLGGVTTTSRPAETAPRITIQ